MLSFSDLVIVIVIGIIFLVLGSLSMVFCSSPLFRFSTESQSLEFLWTAVPGFILFLLLFPSLSLLYLLDEVGLPTSTSKVVGHQWYWSYEVTDSALQLVSIDSYMQSSPLRLLGTDACLNVYSGLVLRFLISSSDVLHSWTVPSWGLKADAVPGRLNILITFLERPGTYFGQCSEICGRNHSFMPIMAEVLPTTQRCNF